MLLLFAVFFRINRIIEHFVNVKLTMSLGCQPDRRGDICRERPVLLRVVVSAAAGSASATGSALFPRQAVKPPAADTAALVMFVEFSLEPLVDMENILQTRIAQGATGFL